MQGLTNSTFRLEEGTVIILPKSFTTKESRNKSAFPETPRVLTVWKEKDDLRCHFTLSAAIDDRVKKIRLFISDKAKGGDSLKIIWKDDGCAGTLHIP